jgi:hypothetical protein
MDFLEDIEMYDLAMRNAYEFVTRKKTIDDIYFELEADTIENYPLPFDPLDHDSITSGVIDLIIEYFTSTEEYEKCADLLKAKERLEKVR